MADADRTVHLSERAVDPPGDAERDPATGIVVVARPAELAVSEVRLPNKRLFTGIVRDISERKRLEAALQAMKEQLETASTILESVERSRSEVF